MRTSFSSISKTLWHPARRRAHGVVSVEALKTLDWKERTVSIRINGFDTPYIYRDFVDVVEQTGNISIR